MFNLLFCQKAFRSSPVTEVETETTAETPLAEAKWGLPVLMHFLDTRLLVPCWWKAGDSSQLNRWCRCNKNTVWIIFVCVIQFWWMFLADHGGAVCDLPFTNLQGILYGSSLDFTLTFQFRMSVDMRWMLPEWPQPSGKRLRKGTRRNDEKR